MQVNPISATLAATLISDTTLRAAITEFFTAHGGEALRLVRGNDEDGDAYEMPQALMHRIEPLATPGVWERNISWERPALATAQGLFAGPYREAVRTGLLTTGKTGPVRYTWQLNWSEMDAAQLAKWAELVEASTLVPAA